MSAGAGITRWEVEPACGTREAFVARVEGLGGAFEGFTVELQVTRAWSGLFAGRLRVGREGGPPETRELEDEACPDVVDALAIAAALTLRSLAGLPPLPEPDVPEGPSELRLTLHEREEGPSRDSPAARVSPVVGMGAHGRVGLGPVPGVAGAVSVSVVVEVERLVVGAHVSHWPEASALLTGEPATPRGVALQALTGTIELGYRVGDLPSPTPGVIAPIFGVTPLVVIEPGVAVARGLGVDAPRDEAVGFIDVGGAVAVHVDLGPMRLFVRGDLLFGALGASYGVNGAIAYASPVVRGTGALGALVFFGR